MSYPLYVGKDVRFPETQNAPTPPLELSRLQSISLRVPADFGYPVGRVVPFGQLRQALFEIASVPEISVAEDDQSLLREDEVRTAGKGITVQPISKAHLPEGMPQEQFALRIRLDARASCSGTRSRRCGPKTFVRRGFHYRRERYSRGEEPMREWKVRTKLERSAKPDS